MTKHSQIIAAVTAGITAGTIPAVFTREHVIALCPSINPVTVQTVLSDESNAKYAKAIAPGTVSLSRNGRGSYSLANPVAPVVTESAVSRIRTMLAEKSAAASLAGNVARVRALAESLKDADARDAILSALNESPASYAELETLCAELAQ